MDDGSPQGRKSGSPRPPQVTARAQLLAFAALLALATLSLGLSLLHLQSGGLWIALGLAGLKAGLVLLFFMQLAAEPFTHKLIALTSAIMLALLVLFAAVDVATREEVAVPPAGASPASGGASRRATGRYT